jgi:hypothetical protein
VSGDWNSSDIHESSGRYPLTSGWNKHAPRVFHICRRYELVAYGKSEFKDNPLFAETWFVLLINVSYGHDNFSTFASRATDDPLRLSCPPSVNSLYRQAVRRIYLVGATVMENESITSAFSRQHSGHKPLDVLPRFSWQRRGNKLLFYFLIFRDVPLQPEVPVNASVYSYCQ